jgi:hypothetical protein
MIIRSFETGVIAFGERCCGAVCVGTDDDGGLVAGGGGAVDVQAERTARTTRVGARRRMDLLTSKKKAPANCAGAFTTAIANVTAG